MQQLAILRLLCTQQWAGHYRRQKDALTVIISFLLVLDDFILLALGSLPSSLSPSRALQIIKQNSNVKPVVFQKANSETDIKFQVASCFSHFLLKYDLSLGEFIPIHF